jgi:hypothetical protein
MIYGIALISSPVAIVIPVVARATMTTGTSKIEKKRRGLNAPCLKALRSAYTEEIRQAAPIWARSVGLLCGLAKIRSF